MALSTGSPASRRLTKLTPLTTRPSFTSRQGMTRFLSIRSAPAADQRQRLAWIKPPVIQRAARNGAGEARAIGLQQPLDVVNRGEPARGDHRNAQGFRERDRRGDVEAL